MTIRQTNTTYDVRLLGNCKLPRDFFLFMTTQLQIDGVSLLPIFLCTGQLEHVFYHHCKPMQGLDIIAAHPQHNHHSLSNSSNSAVFQPQVADAGRCQACCAAAHSTAVVAAQWRSLVLFSACCAGLWPRETKSLDWLRAGYMAREGGLGGMGMGGFPGQGGT